MTEEFINERMKADILGQREARRALPGLTVLDDASDDALAFVVEVYRDVEAAYKRVVHARAADRDWIDAQTRALVRKNEMYGRTPRDAAFASVIGCADRNGRVVVGPLAPNDVDSYTQPHGAQVAPLPPHLLGPHVTSLLLFVVDLFFSELVLFCFV